MIATRFVILLIFVIVAFTVSTSFQSSPDGNTNEVVFVGDFDGTFYFMEVTTRRNWTNAKAFCNNSKMELAKVTSPAEANFLLNSVAGRGSFAFWVNARNGHTVEYLKWEDNGESVNDMEGASFRWEANKIDACLQFLPAINSSIPIYWGTIPCSSTRETLCELRTGNYKQTL